MKIRSWARFVAIICMGLLAGHSLSMVAIIGPAVTSLGPQSFVEVNSITEPTFAAIFPYFFMVLLSSLAIWWVCLLKHWKSREFLMLNLALLCFIDQLYVTYRAQVPLNNIMTTWKQSHQLPPNWEHLRTEWLAMMKYHLALSVVAFVLLLTAHHRRHKTESI
ncbi:DUF1772 domain-containing protein [Bdellovibrio bacteriovorus]|uniref:DUF1772 domain-containing protein n=1 Tax=Bdellovibrio bacteriovorus (strain ATCC 15356 / DSM 50701 / NCIMB 9529 / HD100) TaxID=264462 RepID=Q6MHW2_BDEBA|nr:DUF1772 domain-containing protein [Bdellovibrio bacteriovorus]CAE78220.1 hypothetical protein Bd3422 [Bdellovibrio bacteriovorus HD100]